MEKKNILFFRPKDLFGNMNTKKIRKPFYDVGEFLPSFNKGSQEIARICLSSSTGDVISIRAKKNKNGLYLLTGAQFGYLFRNNINESFGRYGNYKTDLPFHTVIALLKQTNSI
jgi:hypothetical protein